MAYAYNTRPTVVFVPVLVFNLPRIASIVRGLIALSRAISSVLFSAANACKI